MPGAKRRSRSERWRVVAIGGGTGLPVVLTGLKREIGSRIEPLMSRLFQYRYRDAEKEA